jgi:phosphatidylglycerophosphate synthase
VCKLPLLLTLLRALLAPVVVALAVWAPKPWAFGLCLSLAFLSDVFDGMLARRLGVATSGLRRLDSIADSLFYLGATFAAWMLAPTAITSRTWPLALLAFLELARYLFDFAKFGREASYHMWSSKAWGIALFAGFVSLLAFGTDNAAVDAAVWMGIFSDLEGLAISVALAQWRNDIPTLVHALRLR